MTRKHEKGVGGWNRQALPTIVGKQGRLCIRNFYCAVKVYDYRNISKELVVIFSTNLCFTVKYPVDQKLNFKSFEKKEITVSNFLHTSSEKGVD